MSRPRKYKTEAERLQARREQHKKYNSKRSNKSNDNNDNNCYEPNDKNDSNSNKNYKLLYELLKVEHEELKEHNKANEELIEEQRHKIRELENKEEGEWW